MAECRLAALCLQYLTFECLDLNTKPERLRSLACQGYLVFQDYAIAYWFYHLGETVKGAEELLDPLGEAQAELRELDPQAALRKLEEVRAALRDLDVALQDFAACYENDIANYEEVEDKMSQAFSGCDFYPVLKMVMGHISRHREKVSSFTHHI